ncbi:Holliday junction resolvase RuvX [Chitinimonas viridis]|uniref:Putative pre-16S rRNA nuclease n=2 Tax=Chitinimonas TaxID=240411 RepID=A0ABT8B9M7_9NEIS|nr:MULTISPECIES: Holliday junction resolvase RuvX [Chitinimonas]MDN3578480.1 Holliday junction resolvase RuvX [Chitinimonas viridis]GLR12360.1 putative pre-16S rRNA nuclease [Chitinimonas prasina]
MAGYVLAFDFGEVRIGVAGGSTELCLASPLTTITGASNDDKFAAIAKLIAEWQPSQLVVGLPSHLDGTEHDMSRLARTFANRLNGRFNLPVALVDERLTSVEAEELLSEAQTFGKKRKAALDQVAAMRILQVWFDQQGA